MKKSLLALAVLGAISAAAQADSSVTVWGNIDAGVMYSSNPAGHTLGFQDGQLSPSEFGLKGSEDLGGGLKVGFALTGGFNSASGAQDISDAPSGKPGSTGALFGREAKVSIGGTWGTVAAGLQFDPALIATIATEPRGLADSFSLLAPAVGVTLLGFNMPMGAGGAFDANSVSYSYAGNGLYLGALHTFGGQANNSSGLAGNSLGVSYANSGFTGSASYATLNDATGSTSSEYEVFGLGYVNGAFAVRGQYGEYKTMYSVVNPGVAASDVKAYGIGVDWKSSDANRVNLAYYDAKDNGAIGGGKTTMIALLDVYNLSKRTALFAQIASLRVDSNPGISNLIGEIYAVAGTGAPGGNTTLFGFGINHSF